LAALVTAAAAAPRVWLIGLSLAIAAAGLVAAVGAADTAAVAAAVEAGGAGVSCAALSAVAAGVIVPSAAPAAAKGTQGADSTRPSPPRPPLGQRTSVAPPLAGAVTSPAPAPASMAPAAEAAAVARVPLTVIRKAYHVLAVLLLAPPILVDPGFAALALAAALAAFALAEAFRAPRLPPLGPALHGFFVSFTDARDSGELILTHTYLLLGCALPLWLTAALAPVPTAPPAPLLVSAPPLGPAADASAQFLMAAWRALGLFPSGTAAPAVPALWPGAAPVPLEPWWAPELPAAGAVTALAGLLVLGVGDSAASVVGTVLGGPRWPGSRKTFAGTAGAATATAAAVAAAVGGLARSGPPGGAGAGAAVVWGLSVATALVEAVTEHVDNLFLPLLFVAGAAVTLPGAVGLAV
jgi:dolichol kinase